MFRCYLGAGEGHEFELRNAINVEKAVSLLMEGIFDWVFLDDRFAPYKSVLETLPLLQPYLKRSKVIVISSSIEARHLQCAKDLGVHALIDKFQVKPFRRQIFSSSVNSPQPMLPKGLAFFALF